ncbi:hypothetical protein CFOL_v3_02593 [Cephalotus follicularis]|uniref:Reverse transcriptase domain-containing protein n=1 Tax=Cephalotus follicularis TaxID=3775 RepID=A0A1Q3ATS9_CEPFO|nr:hypothetical protein CFOL_v3_02593 [Cephalotus follicularis]
MMKAPAMEKIIETFKQVQINIPLLEVIAHMPYCAKVLKDLCTKKWIPQTPKKAFLVANISAMVVLDTQPLANLNDKIPVIFGRPFLETSNSLINYRNGLMKLSFGNTSVDFNVFHLGKHPTDFDEANAIHSIPDHIDMHFDIDFDGKFSECMRDLEDVDGGDLFDVFSMQPLEPVGPLSTSLPKPSIKEPPKRELKELPYTLKY